MSCDDESCSVSFDRVGDRNRPRPTDPTSLVELSLEETRNIDTRSENDFWTFRASCSEHVPASVARKRYASVTGRVHRRRSRVSICTLLYRAVDFDRP